MRRWRWTIIGGLAVGAFLIAYFFTDLAGRESAGSILNYKDSETTALGAKIYTANCASCHGDALQGQPDWKSPGPDGLLPAPPHDSSGHTWHHPDELLFRITKLGVGEAAGLTDYKSAMPAYRAVLSDKEIIAVLSWIKAQWPEKVQDRHDRLNKDYARRVGR